MTPPGRSAKTWRNGSASCSRPTPRCSRPAAAPAGRASSWPRRASNSLTLMDFSAEALRLRQAGLRQTQSVGRVRVPGRVCAGRARIRSGVQCRRAGALHVRPTGRLPSRNGQPEPKIRARPGARTGSAIGTGCGGCSIRAAARWPFGKEMPMTDLSAAFEAAGLRFLGHWHGGEKWSEFFIKDLDGMDDRLRNEILAMHRSPVIPEEKRAYLVAALGCKGDDPACPLAGSSRRRSGEFIVDQLTASIADALAEAVAAEHRSQAGRKHARREAAAVGAPTCSSKSRPRRASPTNWPPSKIPAVIACCSGFGDSESWLAPRGSRRERLVRGGWRSLAAISATSAAAVRRQSASRMQQRSARGWSQAAVCASAACARLRRRSIASAVGSPASRAWICARFSARPRAARASSFIRRLSTGIGCASGRINSWPVSPRPVICRCFARRRSASIGSEGSSVWTSGCTCATRSTRCTICPIRSC